MLFSLYPRLPVLLGPSLLLYPPSWYLPPADRLGWAGLTGLLADGRLRLFRRLHDQNPNLISEPDKVKRFIIIKASETRHRMNATRQDWWQTDWQTARLEGHACLPGACFIPVDMCFYACFSGHTV